MPRDRYTCRAMVSADCCRVEQIGYHIADVRTVHEVAQHVDLAELEPAMR